MYKNKHFGDTANTTILECDNDTTIYTLAQLPTNSKNGLIPLQKRARSKWFTQQIVKQLLQLDDTALTKYYTNASNCNSSLLQDNGKITSKYCNSRVCNVCNRIRTAKLMNGYILQFSKFSKLEFVTLTRPNVKKSELRSEVEFIIKRASNIIRILRERKKIDISGIRKIEITYNSVADTYHPHLHILCNEDYGKHILELWLKFNPTANIKGQDCREATQESLNELFKYSTKFLVKSNNKNEMDLYVKPLDNIMAALYNKRTFQPFGNIKKVVEDVEEISSQIYDNIPIYEFAYWVWNNESDWENFITKEPLTKYKKPNYKINIYG